MDFTPFLGLAAFAEGERPNADGAKFFGEDRYTLDAVARLVCQHRHTGDPVGAGDVPEAPVLSIADGDGSIGGDATYAYRVAHVAVDGDVGVAGEAAQITTPAGLDIPEAPTAAYQATGGSLIPGSLAYVATAWRGFHTLETLPSAPVFVNLLTEGGTSQQVVLTLTGIDPDADGVNIYRRGYGAVDFMHIATLTDTEAADPFFDDGSAADPSRRAPLVDTSNANNAIVINPAGDLETGEKWRIYRAIVTDGDPTWTNTFLTDLAHDVATYTDIGAATGSGSPREAATALTYPPKIDLATEATGTLSGLNGGASAVEFAALIGVSDVDGTATEVTPLALAPGAPGDLGTGGVVPPGYIGGAAIPIATVKTMLGSSELPFVVPAGPNAGFYELTAAVVDTTDWPAREVPVVCQGMFLGIWSGTQYVQVPGQAAGFHSIDLTGETAGPINVDLADVEPWVDAVIIELPHGGDTHLTISALPLPWRGHLGVLVFCDDDPLRTAVVSTPSGHTFSGRGGVAIDFAPYGSSMSAVADPAERIAPAAAGWSGPTAGRGGTCTLDEGHLALVPWRPGITPVDQLRAAITSTPTSGDEAYLYVIAPKAGSPHLPGDIVATAGPVDLEPGGDILDTLDATAQLVPSATWWLGIHVTTAAAPIDFAGYAPDQHLDPLPAAAPSATSDNTGYIATDAGTSPLTTTATGVTLTATGEAPIVQAHTP